MTDSSLQALVALVVIGTTIWVGVDASQRDWRGNRFANATWKWVVGCLLLWIVIFPVYLVQRTRAQESPLSSATPQAPALRAERDAPIFWWGMLSAAGMIVGGFGPWATILGVSVSGTNGDGWILIILGALALLCVMGEHRRRALAVLNLIVGLAGVATTLYDRSDLTAAVEDAGEFGGIAQVGWGLNLALAASASLAIHALVAIRAPKGSTSAAAPTRPVSLSLPFQTGASPTSDSPAGPAVAPAAGWYVDPDDSTRLRYWDGTGWSDRTATTNDS